MALDAWASRQNRIAKKWGSAKIALKRFFLSFVKGGLARVVRPRNATPLRTILIQNRIVLL
jgi:hypothetical protein